METTLDKMEREAAEVIEEATKERNCGLGLGGAHAGIDQFRVLTVPAELQERRRDLRQAGFLLGSEHYYAQARCDWLDSKGFRRVKPGEMVEALMGEPHNHTEEGKRYTTPWLYKHLEDEYADTWGKKTTVYRKRRKRFLGIPVGPQVTEWSVTHGSPSLLMGSVPVGIGMRVNQVKKLKVFNSVTVIAPSKMFVDPEVLEDPIVIGCVMMFTAKDFCEHFAYYFLGRWDPVKEAEKK